MGYLTHIRRCNAHDLSGFRPFLIDDVQVGFVRPAVRDALLRLSAFETAGDGLRLTPASFEDRSAALAEGAAALKDAGLIKKLRSELYGVKNRWPAPPFALLDRGAVAAFGVRSYGVHVNGWRRASDGGLELRLGRRSMDKAVAPGKLDNMVAGGQPHGLTLMENLIKEAAEEAGASPDLARTARAVGAISYVMEDAVGLKPDVMYCYDLEVPADFTPVNQDGEMAGFHIVSAEEAARIIRETDEFKFNVNLAVIDFLIRRGVIDPDDEPDYAAIVRGLNAPEVLPA